MTKYDGLFPKLFLKLLKFAQKSYLFLNLTRLFFLYGTAKNILRFLNRTEGGLKLTEIEKVVGEAKAKALPFECRERPAASLFTSRTFFENPENGTKVPFISEPDTPILAIQDGKKPFCTS